METAIRLRRRRSWPIDQGRSASRIGVERAQPSPNRRRGNAAIAAIPAGFTTAPAPCNEPPFANAAPRSATPNAAAQDIDTLPAQTSNANGKQARNDKLQAMRTAGAARNLCKRHYNRARRHGILDCYPRTRRPRSMHAPRMRQTPLLARTMPETSLPGIRQVNAHQLAGANATIARDTPPMHQATCREDPALFDEPDPSSTPAMAPPRRQRRVRLLQPMPRARRDRRTSHVDRACGRAKLVTALRRSSRLRSLRARVPLDTRQPGAWPPDLDCRGSRGVPADRFGCRRAERV